MDGQRFDGITKALAATASRRDVARGAAGSVIAGAGALFAGAVTDAAPRSSSRGTSRTNLGRMAAMAQQPPELDCSDGGTRCTTVLGTICCALRG